MGSNDQRSTIRKVAVSSFLGNFIEWFDYATYSYFAVVIANVFFPGDDPALALMQTFAVFALSFLLRPIGAIFWGSIGRQEGPQVGPVHVHLPDDRRYLSASAC